MAQGCCLEQVTFQGVRRVIAWVVQYVRHAFGVNEQMAFASHAQPHNVWLQTAASSCLSGALAHDNT